MARKAGPPPPHRCKGSAARFRLAPPLPRGGRWKGRRQHRWHRQFAHGLKPSPASPASRKAFFGGIDARLAARLRSFWPWARSKVGPPSPSGVSITASKSRWCGPPIDGYRQKALTRPQLPVSCWCCWPGLDEASSCAALTSSSLESASSWPALKARCWAQTLWQDQLDGLLCVLAHRWLDAQLRPRALQPQRVRHAGAATGCLKTRRQHGPR